MHAKRAEIPAGVGHNQTFPKGRMLDSKLNIIIKNKTKPSFSENILPFGKAWLGF